MEKPQSSSITTGAPNNTGGYFYRTILYLLTLVARLVLRLVAYINKLRHPLAPIGSVEVSSTLNVCDSLAITSGFNMKVFEGSNVSLFSHYRLHSDQQHYQQQQQLQQEQQEAATGIISSNSTNRNSDNNNNNRVGDGSSTNSNSNSTPNASSSSSSSSSSPSSSNNSGMMAPLVPKAITKHCILYDPVVGSSTTTTTGAPSSSSSVGGGGTNSSSTAAASASTNKTQSQSYNTPLQSHLGAPPPLSSALLSPEHQLPLLVWLVLPSDASTMTCTVCSTICRELKVLMLLVTVAPFENCRPWSEVIDFVASQINSGLEAVYLHPYLGGEQQYQGWGRWSATGAATRPTATARRDESSSVSSVPPPPPVDRSHTTDSNSNLGSSNSANSSRANSISNAINPAQLSWMLDEDSTRAPSMMMGRGNTRDRAKVSIFLGGTGLAAGIAILAATNTHRLAGNSGVLHTTHEDTLAHKVMVLFETAQTTHLKLLIQRRLARKEERRERAAEDDDDDGLGKDDGNVKKRTDSSSSSSSSSSNSNKENDNDSPLPVPVQVQFKSFSGVIVFDPFLGWCGSAFQQPEMLSVSRSSFLNQFRMMLRQALYHASLQLTQGSIEAFYLLEHLDRSCNAGFRHNENNKRDATATGDSWFPTAPQPLLQEDYSYASSLLYPLCPPIFILQSTEGIWLHEVRLLQKFAPYTAMISSESGKGSGNKNYQIQNQNQNQQQQLLSSPLEVAVRFYRPNLTSIDIPTYIHDLETWIYLVSQPHHSSFVSAQSTPVKEGWSSSHLYHQGELFGTSPSSLIPPPCLGSSIDHSNGISGQQHHNMMDFRSLATRQQAIAALLSKPQRYNSVGSVESLEGLNPALNQSVDGGSSSYDNDDDDDVDGEGDSHTPSPQQSSQLNDIETPTPTTMILNAHPPLLIDSSNYNGNGNTGSGSAAVSASAAIPVGSGGYYTSQTDHMLALIPNVSSLSTTGGSEVSGSPDVTPPRNSAWQ